MRRLAEESLRNIVVGAGLFGAGGGGSIKEGMKIVDHILQFDDGVDLIEASEAGNTDWGAVIAGMGSPKASLELARTFSPTIALEYLEKELNFTSSFVIPFEIGAGNSLNPMLAAVHKKIPIVDGDPCGRAVPQVDMTTFFIGGLSISPFALTTEDGIRIMIYSNKPSDIERIGRAITTELQGVSATSCHAMNGKDLKRLIIPGTTTMVENLGETIKKCQKSHEEVTARIVQEYDGYILGKGRVSSIDIETRDAFDFGTVNIEGEIPVKVLFKNENIIAYRDGKVIAIVPDLICAISKDGMPLTNADITNGMEVTYLGFKANDKFRNRQVFEMFSQILKAMKYTGPFIPIEEIYKR